ncbi:hypothetical protein SAMN02745166_00750 [Prosthecobacter debontii]|uniref:Uncharacterized protein n=2 Tax=Prosthecobacter debontii TaxID=48467 RepID=A0A1T4WXL7_9BACT|nr:hypothetical protein SAMN02745166_00750 [Prosthecobacter debontii]
MTLMNRSLLLITLAGTMASAHAEVVVDIEAFGKSLGGWLARKGKAAEYEMSEADYRTYQPEVSPSPDGGIFVSVRIDHCRGFFASDDHASLELSFAPNGDLVSAQSSLALQGRTITSELIKGGASATTSVAAPQIDRAVKVGTDLVADLSSKLLREKVVEPGRVSFPAAIRHNYNLLYQAVKYQTKPEVTATTSTPPAGSPATATTPANNTPPPAATNPAQPNSTAPPPPASTPPSPPTTSPPNGNEAAAPNKDHLVPTNKAAKDDPAKSPPAAPKPPPAPASTAPTTTDAATGKTIPLPDIKAYNPSGAPSTPLPASTASKSEKEKSLLMEHGGEMLKLARDVVKTTAAQ